jgi:hypothetical protein
VKTDDLTERDVALVLARVDRICPLLAGLGPAVQSAILADLVARWLAGHRGDALLVEELFSTWVDTVRDLVASARREVQRGEQERG